MGSNNGPSDSEITAAWRKEKNDQAQEYKDAGYADWENYVVPDNQYPSNGDFVTYQGVQYVHDGTRWLVDGIY